MRLTYILAIVLVPATLSILAPASAALIDFETDPTSAPTVDDYVLNSPYPIVGGSVSMYFDNNTNFTSSLDIACTEFMNTNCITDKFGSKSRKSAEFLCQRGRVDCQKIVAVHDRTIYSAEAGVWQAAADGAWQFGLTNVHFKEPTQVLLRFS